MPRAGLRFQNFLTAAPLKHGSVKLASPATACLYSDANSPLRRYRPRFPTLKNLPPALSTQRVFPAIVPCMKTSRAITLLEVVVILAVLVVLWALLFPAVSSHSPESAPRAQAKNDVVQLATAVTAFRTEYGRLPGSNTGPVGGELLTTLMGGSNTLNPRQIVFLEVQNAKKGRSGLSNGFFIDPWGGTYQIAFDADSNGTVIAGTNNIEVKKRVAVWTDPKLGNDGSWFKPARKDRRYVTSWE